MQVHHKTLTKQGFCTDLTYGSSVNDNRWEEGPLILDHVWGGGTRVCGAPRHHVIRQPQELLHICRDMLKSDCMVNSYTFQMHHVEGDGWHSTIGQRAAPFTQTRAG